MYLPLYTLKASMSSSLLRRGSQFCRSSVSTPAHDKHTDGRKNKEHGFTKVWQKVVAGGHTMVLFGSDVKRVAAG
ncbi:hypothetical protein GN956_G9089 [Arapaima gigas]